MAKMVNYIGDYAIDDNMASISYHGQYHFKLYRAGKMAKYYCMPCTQSKGSMSNNKPDFNFIFFKKRGTKYYSQRLWRGYGGYRTPKKKVL